jgi:hypothetical protein
MSGEPSIEMELDRSIQMQRWPGRPASKLALTNQGTPALPPKPTVLDGFISNDVQLPNGLVTKLNEDIKNNK